MIKTEKNDIIFEKKQLRKINKKSNQIYKKPNSPIFQERIEGYEKRENCTLTEMYRCPINDSWRTGHVSGISNASSPEFDDLIPDLLLNFSV